MRFLALVFVVVLFVPPAASAEAGSTRCLDPRWRTPVAGPIVREFVAPAGPYAPGHRGIDYAVAAGTPVRAVAGGRVMFAGTVANARFVVVLHANRLVTYGYLVGVYVHTGETVTAGRVLGTTGGADPADPDHDGSVFHLGVRVGGNYVDPLGPCPPLDLTAVVHLAPVPDRTPSTIRTPGPALPTRVLWRVLAGM